MAAAGVRGVVTGESPPDVSDGRREEVAVLVLRSGGACRRLRVVVDTSGVSAGADASDGEEGLLVELLLVGDVGMDEGESGDPVVASSRASRASSTDTLSESV